MGTIPLNVILNKLFKFNTEQFTILSEKQWANSNTKQF